MRGLDPQLQLDPADALERPLRDRALGVQQIADHPQGTEQHRPDEQHRAGDQRLDVTAACRRGMLGEDDHEADEQGQRGQPHDQSTAPEDLERLVL
jgi:hypothetical protein